MVPTRNLLHHDTKNSKPCYQGQYCVGIAAQLEASPAVAARQDHHRPSRSTRPAMDDEEPGVAAGTSSRSGAGAGDWLQLGLAGTSSSSASTSGSGDNNGTDPAAAPPSVEIGLFTYGYDNQRARTMRPPLFPLPLRSYQYGHGRHRPTAASGSMSAPFMPQFRSSGDAIRVVSPPRQIMEAAGLWLTLQAAPSQVREPILPQIPKSYLRIKDSNMKVEVVMKYLADRLGLTWSHQVELTCRGQLLPPFLVVKYVRDNIWFSSPLREEEALAGLHARRPPPATTTDHIMTLCYSISSN